MIRIRRTALTHLELAASDALDHADVQRGGEALAAALSDGARATLLLDLRELEDLSMRALASHAALGARLRPMLERLERVALVGDGEWLATLLALQSSAAPELETRRFDAAAIAEARRWAGGSVTIATDRSPDADADADADVLDIENATPEPERTYGDGREMLEGLIGTVFDALGQRTSSRFSDATQVDARRGADEGGSARAASPAGLRIEERDGLLILDLDGRVSRDDVERVAARLDAAGSGDVALLARLTRFEGFDPAALLSPALWRLQGEGLSRLSRVALITSIDWLGRAVESAATRHRVDMRGFLPADESAAITWLNDRSASSDA